MALNARPCTAHIRARTFYLVAMPVLMTLDLVGITVITAITKQPLSSWPLLIPLLVIAQQVRWCMMWLSTEEERKSLRPYKDPVLLLLTRATEHLSRKLDRNTNTIPPRIDTKRPKSGRVAMASNKGESHAAPE
jgi:hypothetical protein